MTIVINKTGTTREDLAWAAGLFDGEGCITHRPKAPVCVMAMTDEDVVRKFHSVVGIGSVFWAYRKNAKPILYWTAAGFRSAQYVIALLWFRLGERRRARAVEIIKRFAAMPGRRPKLCKRGHSLYDEQTTTINNSGARVCLICSRAKDNARKKRYREERKASATHEFS